MKVKKCPCCGHANPPNELDCQGPCCCGVSLLSVPITDNEEPTEKSTPEPVQEMPEPQNPGAVPAQKAKYFRICPTCHRHASPNTYKCEECSRMLYGVPLVSSDTEETQPAQDRPPAAYVLCSEDGRLSIQIHDGEMITVGREAAGSEYLSNKLYVGRKHMDVRLRDGIVYITDINKTNKTLVNGVAIRKNTPYKLSENDLISLGALEGQPPVHDAAYFRLKKGING